MSSPSFKMPPFSSIGRALLKLAFHSVGKVTKCTSVLMPIVRNPPINIIIPGPGNLVIKVTTGAALKLEHQIFVQVPSF